jgi:DNA replication protein DnaC
LSDQETTETHVADVVPPEWAERDATARRIAAAEEAEKEKKRSVELEKVKLSTGIPAKFLKLVEAGVRETGPMAEALIEVRKAPFDILVLAGDVGRGKTSAASWWLMQALHDRNRPLFVTGPRLARWERYDNAEMTKILSPCRLVIDDLGEEFNDTKGNFLTLFDEILADRAGNHRPTIITTNLLAPSFKLRYGQRVQDRIRESGRFQEFMGPSFRTGQQLGLLPATDGVHS